MWLQALYNLTLPNWAVKYTSQLKNITNLSFKLFGYTHELKRLRGGKCQVTFVTIMIYVVILKT